MLHFWQRPFKDWTHNILEAVSVVLLFVLYDTEQYLSSFVGPQTEETITLLLDVVEVAGFVLILPFIVRDLRHMILRCLGRSCGRCCCCCCRTAGGRRGEGDDFVGAVHDDYYRETAASSLTMMDCRPSAGSMIQLSDRNLLAPAQSTR